MHQKTKVRASLCAGAYIQTCSHLTWKVKNSSSVRRHKHVPGTLIRHTITLANAGLPCCCHGSSWYGKWQILVSLRLHSVRCESAVKVANEQNLNRNLSILMQSHQAIVAPADLAKQCKIALSCHFDAT